MGCRTVIKKFITNCTPTCPDVEDWVFSNANVTGEGVFYQQAGTAVEFYGITNTDGYITVSLDAANKVISIDIDPDLIAGSIPDATTTVKGKVELSTDAEAQAQTDTVRALTPSNLAAVTATTIRSGLVELATNAETITGTDTDRATTPAGVKAAMDAVTPIQVVANAAARTAATPVYIGQQLYQSDAETTYFGTSLAAGGWEGPYLKGGATNTIASDTTLDLTGGDLILTDSAAAVNKLIVGSGATLELGAGKLNIDLAARVYSAGVIVPAYSVFTTSNTAGAFAPTPLTSFLCAESDTSEYTVGVAAPSRTLSDASVLADVINVLAAVVDDLNQLRRPIYPA